ncbi:MAG: PDZ domain-containing protein [Anaerolineaceae bacterium]|nr:MAG: PDZ domain-containing protein [Anaerolineaceae bacterium]
MKWKLLFTSLLASILLSGSLSNNLKILAPPYVHADNLDTNHSCSSFCLDNGDHCIFGANQDNQIDIGQIFVNKRNVLKTAWDPSTTGEYARWISKYGSVTVVHAGYQMAWAGMNEAGLMISTMALAATQNPAPDERPPLASSFWAQYQLDNHSTIDEVIASDPLVRIHDTVDHYLVCDRNGDCATIEFLEGKMVVHSGEMLPVKALTNSTYREAFDFWEEGGLIRGILVHEVGPDSPIGKAGIRAGDWITAIGDVKLDGDNPVATLISEINTNYEGGDEVHLSVLHQGDQEPVTVSLELKSYTTEEGEEVLILGRIALSSGNSLYRFVTLAERLIAYEVSNTVQAVTYAFETLAEVAGESNAWQLVFDPEDFMLYLRSNGNPAIRYVDFSQLDFSCQTPVTMLDVHTGGPGAINSDLYPYDNKVSLAHAIEFFDLYERIEISPLLLGVLLSGLERFPCMEGNQAAMEEPALYLDEHHPLIPPRIEWIFIWILQGFWPVWIFLIVASLILVFRRRNVRKAD